MSKRVIVLDAILFLFALVFCIFCSKQANMMYAVIGIVVMIAVIGYILLSIYFSMFYEEKIEDKITKADKKGFFKKETKKFIEQVERLENREKLFTEERATENLKDAYDLIKDKVMTNILTAIGYMKTYDYVAKPDCSYLYELRDENDKLLDQLNTLIELNLKADNTSYMINTDSIDDLISSLDKVTKGE